MGLIYTFCRLPVAVGYRLFARSLPVTHGSRTHAHALHGYRFARLFTCTFRFLHTHRLFGFTLPFGYGYTLPCRVAVAVTLHVLPHGSFWFIYYLLILPACTCVLVARYGCYAVTFAVTVRLLHTDLRLPFPRLRLVIAVLVLDAWLLRFYRAFGSVAVYTLPACLAILLRTRLLRLPRYRWFLPVHGLVDLPYHLYVTVPVAVTLRFGLHHFTSYAYTAAVAFGSLRFGCRLRCGSHYVYCCTHL